MKSALGAAAILGSSSMVAVLVGLVTAKATALLVGPEGLGGLGLMQSLVTLTVTLCAVGVGTGVVRLGAGGESRGDDPLPALARAAWRLTALGAIAAGLLLGLFGGPISDALLGSGARAADATVLAIAVAFMLAAHLRTGLLNARHRVRTLARLQLVTSLASGAATVAALLIWRERGLALAVVFAAAAAVGVAEWFGRLDGTTGTAGATATDTRTATRALVRFGVPFTGSLLVGTGVQLLLPALVLHTLGDASVGYYRAALGLSAGYLAILLAAMARDYYPRVANRALDGPALARVVHDQQRLVMVIGAPIILGLITLAPLLVPLVYARSFAPAVQVLEWLLIGELFRFSSWTLAYVVLARGQSSVYFGMELLAGLTLLGTSWVGGAVFGLRGVGMAYACSFVVYLALTWIVSRRLFGVIWPAANVVTLGLAVAAALLVMRSGGDGRLLPRLAVGGVATGLALLAGARTIRRELRAS